MHIVYADASLLYSRKELKILRFVLFFFVVLFLSTLLLKIVQSKYTVVNMNLSQVM